MNSQIMANTESYGIDISALVEAVKVCARANTLTAIIVDIKNERPVFMTDNLIYVDETFHSDFLYAGVNPYRSLLSNDYVDVLSQVREEYLALRSVLTEDEYRSHTCVMDFPISIKNRNLFVNAKFSPLTMSPDGTIRLGVFFVSPSCRTSMAFLVISSTGRRWTYDFEERCFKEYDLGFKLTITEKAILERARTGLSSEEIASSLYLSVNTVKSHKRRIFQKLKVKNITEALIVIGNYQLL